MKPLMKDWRKFLAEARLDNIAQELGIELRTYDIGKNILVLSKIVVPEKLRGQGVGSTAMEKVIQYADANKKTVALTPSSDFGGNKNQLIKFYKKFGFVMNAGRNKNFETQETMIREPKVAESKQLDEAITLDIEVGDIVLGGKFKNKRIEVKEIGKDDLGQPTINGKPLLKFRIEKHLPDDKKSKKTLDAEKSLNEGYYEINPKNPPPIKDVLEDWVDGKKAYDAGSMITGRSIPYHGYYSVDELWDYREYDWSAEKHRGSKEQWDALVASIKKGFNPKYPVMVNVGKNGVAKIGEGNHRTAIAKQLGIKMIPVNFIFQQSVYLDRNSFQVHDQDNPEALQTLADDSPEQLKTAAKELNREKENPDFEWDETTQELYDMIMDIM